MSPEGMSRVFASIGPGDELISIWVSGPEIVVVRQHTEYEVRTRITDLPLEYPLVQPMPEGQILIVDPRCDSDPNAILYDAEGRQLMAATFGDGIEHVLTTASGNVWVGYFDEGVFGDDGWGEAGLARFGPDLQRQWRFPPGSISDCYALNVDGEDAWTCYYTDFPVARVHQDRVTEWSNQDTRGARALAVSGDTVALFGGYPGDRDRLVIGTLAEGAFRKTSEHRLPVPEDASVVGRGPALHAITAEDWYQFDLREWR